MNPSLGQRLTQNLMSHRRPFSSQTRREKMENSPVAKCRYKLWFVVFALFVLWYLLLYVYNWSSFHGLTPIVIKTSESKNRIEYDDQKQAIEKKLEPSNLTFLAKNEAEHDHHDRENEEEPIKEVDKSHANSENRIGYADKKQAIKKKLKPRNQTFLAKNEEAEHDHGRENEEEPIKEVDKSHANSIKPSVSKNRIEYADQKQAIKKKLEPRNQTFLAKNEADHDHGRENEEEPIKEVDKSHANYIKPSVSKNRIEYTDQKQVIKKKLEPRNQTFLAKNEAEHDHHDRENEEEPIKEVDKSHANSIKPSVSKNRIEYADQKQAIKKKLEPTNQTFLAKNEAEHDHGRENEEEPIKEVDKSHANSIKPSVSKNRIEYADQKQAIEKKMEPSNQTLLAKNKAEHDHHDRENEEDPIKGVEKDNWAKQATISSQPIVNNTIEEPVTEKPSVDSCSGRYIYVHDIPSRFNDDLLKQCSSLDKWMNMCEYITNMGLGERNETTGWFATNQFTLELIVHNRMKQYECLTNDSSKASAIFVPFYTGLEISRHLFDFNTSVRDSGSLDLVKWLREKPEWNVMYGRDHFLVAGRITWDFRRGMDDDKYWGNKLMRLPEAKNMTMLTIESSPWDRNDFAIPYPTYFHPSSDNEVFIWQRKMRRQKRDFLFSFAGAPRPDREDSIRNEIIEQCQKAGSKCKFLRCTNFENKCTQPVYVMEIFQNSVFCLQPPGDSLTRRSTFDSILAGCIPVFFHPGSAYIQYLWHLPKNFTKYSVLIPEDGVKNRSVSIERVLRSIPKQKRAAMRKEVIKLIPKVTYADPRSKLKKLEDAFDITVKGVLERVERLRKEIREGRNSSFDFDEEYTWKYNFFGIQGKHEWDHFFNRTEKGKKWQEGQQRE